MLTAAVVLASDPGTVTRSFVAYINGNHVLIGRRIRQDIRPLDGYSTAALAAAQAQRTLAMAVSEGETAREITPVLSRGVADDIRHAEVLPKPDTRSAGWRPS